LLLQFLLEHQALMEAIDIDQALDAACRHGHRYAVLLLLADAGLAARANLTLALEVLACCPGPHDVVFELCQMFLELGADPSGVLPTLAQQGHLEAVRLVLCDARVDACARDD